MDHLFAICDVSIVIGLDGYVHQERVVRMSICENGIVAESRFVPWRRFERAGWCIDDGILKFGNGMSQYAAIVPTGRRAEIEEFLAHKI